MAGFFSVLMLSELSAAMSSKTNPSTTTAQTGTKEHHQDQGHHEDMQKHYGDMKKDFQALDASLNAIEPAIQKISDANTKTALEAFRAYEMKKHDLMKKHHEFMEKSHGDWCKEHGGHDHDKDDKSSTQKSSPKDTKKK